MHLLKLYLTFIGQNWLWGFSLFCFPFSQRPTRRTSDTIMRQRSRKSYMIHRKIFIRIFTIMMRFSIQQINQDWNLTIIPCALENIYPCTGMVRMVLMLANIVLKCSGSFLKPISVSTIDWVISLMETQNDKQSLLKTWNQLVMHDFRLWRFTVESCLIWAETDLLRYCFHLVDVLKTATLTTDVIINIYLLVQTL